MSGGTNRRRWNRGTQSRSCAGVRQSRAPASAPSSEASVRGSTMPRPPPPARTASVRSPGPTELGGGLLHWKRLFVHVAIVGERGRGRSRILQEERGRGRASRQSRAVGRVRRVQRRPTAPAGLAQSPHFSAGTRGGVPARMPAPPRRLRRERLAGPSAGRRSPRPSRRRRRSRPCAASCARGSRGRGRC